MRTQSYLSAVCRDFDVESEEEVITKSIWETYINFTNYDGEVQHSFYNYPSSPEGESIELWLSDYDFGYEIGVVIINKDGVNIQYHQEWLKHKYLEVIN